MQDKVPGTVMRVTWLEGGELQMREAATPRVDAGQAVVRVRLAGICGTDLELARGYAAFAGIPGHEFVGEVVAAPDDDATPWTPGRRVVGEINVRCDACRECRAGRDTHCLRRKVIGIRGRDGAFADYVRVPVANLHAIPDDVPDEAAVFAEPLAAALAIRDRVRLDGSERILLVGAGRLGQLVARVLRAHGCTKLEAIARHPRQRALLAAADVPAVAEDDVEHAAYDVTIDTSGSESGLALARWALRPRGTLVVKSTHHGARDFDFAQLVVDEITVVGSRCGPFAPALAHLANGTIDPRPLIDAILPLTDARAAFAAAARPGALKILLRPGAP
jgi:threonine dehydrogenase-like Zn-dependent dehydrogenase